VFDTENKRPPGKRPPTGYRRGGLVMACGLGRQVLDLGALPKWWDPEAEFRAVIAEGETDFLTWCTGDSNAALFAPATFGIFSGSWTQAIADRIPDGATVVIATDTDPLDKSKPERKPAGDIYAEKIIQTVTERMNAHRIKVERWRP